MKSINAPSRNKCDVIRDNSYPKECRASARSQGQLHRSSITAEEHILTCRIQLCHLNITVCRDTTINQQLQTRITAKLARASPVGRIEDWIGDDVLDGEIHTIGTTARSSSDRKFLRAPVGIKSNVRDVEEITLDQVREDGRDGGVDHGQVAAFAVRLNEGGERGEESDHTKEHDRNIRARMGHCSHVDYGRQHLRNSVDRRSHRYKLRVLVESRKLRATQGRYGAVDQGRDRA